MRLGRALASVKNLDIAIEMHLIVRPVRWITLSDRPFSNLIAPPVSGRQADWTWADVSTQWFTNRIDAKIVF